MLEAFTAGWAGAWACLTDQGDFLELATLPNKALLSTCRVLEESQGAAKLHALSDLLKCRPRRLIIY